MSTDEQYTQCIACKHNLHYKPIEDWMSNTTFDLPYCPNSDCLRYGLYTLEADELLEDKVSGFTEKQV